MSAEVTSVAPPASVEATMLVVGAKRRKPNKVTQIQPAAVPPPVVTPEDKEETMDEEQQEDELPERPATPQQAQQQSTKSNELIQQHKLPNPLPPGMPPPPISSTSVVEPLDQIYTCPLCHETQATQKEFTTHIRGHNEVKPYNDPNDPSGQSKVYFCCLCGKMLSSFSSLDRHMLVHSGERPFSCDLCGQTFTTNGNMHRHKRTHGSRDAAAAAAAVNSGGNPGSGNGLNLSTDSGRSRVGRKRKQINSNDDSSKKIANGGTSNGDFKCPACSDSFSSELNLDHHMYEVHPGQEVVCGQCSFTCPNYNYLKLHKTMFHFSSISLTNTSTPCTSIISQLPTTPITTSVTARPDSPVPLMIKPRIPSNIISAAAAAAAEAALKEPLDEKDEEEEEEEDLADVQSMLKLQSNTVQDIDKGHHDSDTETSVMEEKTLSSHEGICLVEDPIIRDMKLKGEFPCRLCPAVYPNLRALKGHNKEHLGKPPYVCNVGACTYSSNDKSTLTRHMRTHTGEKPFECKLCNYGFTTKANCERHLKNKHGKTSREAIRTSIIVHESETDTDNKMTINNDSESSNQQVVAVQDQFRCKVCKQIFSSSAKVIAHAVKDHPAYSNDVDHIFEEVKTKSNISRLMVDVDGAPSMVPRPLAMIDQLPKNKNEQDSSEAPLDLSSRPSRPASTNSGGDSVKTSSSIYSNMPTLKMHGKIPMMLQTPSPGGGGGPTQPPIPSSDLLSNNFGILSPGFPFILPTPAANGNASRGPTGQPGFPFLFSFLPTNTQALAAANLMNFMPNFDALPAEIKEQMKARLGGGASNPVVAGDLASVHQEYLRKQTEFKEQKEAAEALQHLSKVQSSPLANGKASSSPVSVEKAQAPSTTGEDNGKSDSDSNYKMVIKNGVLMKKQKQRRYRTERPYSCNFCEARFTLRSNMERHIKQQHPQHWCQKPRGSRRNHTATVPVIAPQFRNNENEESDVKGEENNINSENSKPEEKTSENLEEDLEDEEEEGFEVLSDNDQELVIDEPCTTSSPVSNTQEDLASVSKLLNTASSQSFQKYFDHEEDEENSSGGSNPANVENRKKSAYSAAPHKIACPYCERKFPWTSSLKRHILTHTGHKPYKCPECTLWFTTKSNCDRHLIRKHGASSSATSNNNHNNSASNSDSSLLMRNVPDRPYKCKLCPSSSFSSASNLRKHELSKHLMVSSDVLTDTNEGEGDDEFSMEEIDIKDQDQNSPFRCHICHEGFEVRALALSHMRSNHTEECASIEASVNNKLESQLSNLSGSEKQVQKYEVNGKAFIECIFCPFASRTFLELRRHVSKDHGVKYTCDICQKSYSLKRQLVRHKKKHDSGVSSGDESELELDQTSNGGANGSNKSSQNQVINTSSPALSSKKKPSLMDTINKLSKQKQQEEEDPIASN